MLVGLTVVDVCFNGFNIGKKNIDRRYHRISLGYKLTRALPKEHDTFSVSYKEGDLTMGKHQSNNTTDGELHLAEGIPAEDNSLRGGNVTESQYTRKEILEMGEMYNALSNRLMIEVPLEIIICFCAIIGDLFLFMILPKFIGIIILLVAVIRFIRACLITRKIQDDMHDIANKLRDSEAIINDIMANPVMEYDPEYQIINDKGSNFMAHFMSMKIWVTMDLVSAAIVVMLLIGLRLEPSILLVILVISFTWLTVFLIYKTVDWSRKQKANMQIILNNKPGDMIDIPIMKLNMLKRSIKKINGTF